MPNETIGECSARYDALLHKIDSVQSEIALLSSRSSVNPEDYRTRICELERMISHLSEEADQVYALLAHSISVSVDRRYPEAGSDTLFAKRVIGLPGDTLWAEDDVLTINGEYYDTIPGTGDWIADVPDGFVFFLGDNRGNSCDSRYFGCIALEQLTTKILFSLPFS